MISKHYSFDRVWGKWISIHEKLSLAVMMQQPKVSFRALSASLGLGILHLLRTLTWRTQLSTRWRLRQGFQKPQLPPFPACALHVSHAQHELNISDQGLNCLVLHSVVARGGNAWLATVH